jgi:hypothetical protein
MTEIESNCAYAHGQVRLLRDGWLALDQVIDAPV